MNAASQRAGTLERVMSLVPALPGWWAISRDEAGETREPVLAWALMEFTWHDGHGRVSESARSVVAMVPDGEAAALVPAIAAEYVGLIFGPLSADCGERYVRG